jgi:NAD(P)-dependent dehydrogenase (short-subunit alcohol dehydrogenase family)
MSSGLSGLDGGHSEDQSGRFRAKAFSSAEFRIFFALPVAASCNIAAALMALDTTDAAQIERTAKDVIAQVGVDVVFSNAGYGMAGPLEGFTDEQIVRMIDTR